MKASCDIVRSAKLLRDWLLPYGHPEKGLVGIHPWNLSDDDITYRCRDENAMKLCDFILKMADEQEMEFNHPSTTNTNGRG